MADLFHLIGHNHLLDHLDPQAVANVQSIGYDYLQHALLREQVYHSLSVSVPADCSGWEAVSALEESKTAKWQEVSAVLRHYKLKPLVPAGEHSVSDIVQSVWAEVKSQPSLRQLPLELRALAEKDRGNSHFKEMALESALRSYSKALASLGLASIEKVDWHAGVVEESDLEETDVGDGVFDQPKKKKPRPKPNQEKKRETGALRSAELTAALYSNRSLCFLRLGHALRAMEDARFGLARLDSERAAHLQAWTKAKHRLASALVRAARFKEAVTELDGIERANKSRTATAELRNSIKKLLELCSPRQAASEATLPKHLAAQKAELMNAFLEAPAEMAWFAVRERLSACPLLFLVDLSEVWKKGRKLPGKMLNMLAMILRTQDPLNPFMPAGGLSGSNACKLRSMITKTYQQSDDERERRKSLMRISEGRSADFALSLMEEMGIDVEDHPEAEEVHQELLMLMRFVLAYAELDAFQWQAAKETLHRLIFHITVSPNAPKYFPQHINRIKSPGRKDFKNPYIGSQELNLLPFPRWYLAELMHLLAVCECGIGDASACNSAISTYFDLVPSSFLDRNYESAMFLRAWSELKPLQLSAAADFTARRDRRVISLRKEASNAGKMLEDAYSGIFEPAFASGTWVEARFYHDLGCRPLPAPFDDIYAKLEQQRRPAGMPGMPDMYGDFESFVGRAEGVTVRYRVSLEEKARQAQRGRGPSDLGAFRGMGPFGMPDMENELYEMQQNMFASCMGGFGLGGLGMGGGPFGGAGLFGGSADPDDEEDEEEEDCDDLFGDEDDLEDEGP
mmetsp:Transcript_52354/g.125014  ORF Transcript_52354/g.125014 Transcript_52354/m.125014 type:complete len:798 (+) Transcript_52354:62-2455(+)